MLFHLINFYALFTVETFDQCGSTAVDDCHVLSWSSWGSCSGTCGNQTRTRERLFVVVMQLNHGIWRTVYSTVISLTLLKVCNSNNVVFVKTEESCSQFLILVFAVHGTKGIAVKVGLILKNIKLR